MQDAINTLTSDASAALTGSLVNDLAHGHARCDDTQHLKASNTLKTRGKKRVRRMQHIELPFFRHQARELELKLKRLKLQSGSRMGIIKSEFASPRLVQNLVENRSDQNSVWNCIAERQLKERLRVEQQQQKLKETHMKFVNLSMELHKLLKKCDESQQMVAESVTAKQQRYWDFKVDPADEIFADQLAIVTRMRLQRQGPSRTLYLESGLSMGREMVRWDSSIKAGFVLEARCGTTLPFGLDVAADAYWRFFGCGYGMDRVVHNESDLLAGTIARSFKIRTNFEGFTSKVGGKYTARRYVDEDGGITIMSAGSGDIEEINGVKFSGTQLHKRGCIRLRRVPRQGPEQESTSTVVEYWFETVPVFRDSANKAQQTQALLDANDEAYHVVDKLFCQRMGSLLLEEDWKATFGRDRALEA